ncbi:Fermitin family-like protein [Ooceraea biroi]|uniref:Fermitin family-like protein n=1 Tax=Ooceraea biroi TaxID=2015173 RepID=A0A026WUB9_OOCBI|nr:Fermitin family-like protein [Ooceraea biroi]
MYSDGHEVDGSWVLRVYVTDLQVERSLRVKGELHIGGVMLRLVEDLDCSTIISKLNLKVFSTEMTSDNMARMSLQTTIAAISRTGNSSKLGIDSYRMPNMSRKYCSKDESFFSSNDVSTKALFVRAENGATHLARPKILEAMMRAVDGPTRADEEMAATVSMKLHSGTLTE